MKTTSLLLLTLLLCFNSKSQNVNRYEFIGALTTNNNIISYKLSFFDNGNGVIEGYSVTDFYGANKTKSKITGKIDTKHSRLSFKETENISTQSSEEDSVFCYININNLKIRKVKSSLIVGGDFKGLYPSGKECASGTIYLVSKDFIEKLEASVDTTGMNRDTLTMVDSLLKIAKEPVTKEKIIKKNEVVEMPWKQEQISFEIWDGNKEDGDMINIYYNGKLIEQELIITSARQTINVPFSSKQGVIRIAAVNEGTAIANTVNFKFKADDEIKTFSSFLRKGEEFTIKFNKQ